MGYIKKRTWQRDMMDLYFFEVVDAFEDGGYIFENYGFIDYRETIKTYEADGLEEFLTFVNEYYFDNYPKSLKSFCRKNNASEDFEKRTVFKKEHIYKNKYGHWQIDINVFEDRRGETFVFDETRTPVEENMFYVLWDKVGLNSFKDIKNYDYYFPNKIMKRFTLLHFDELVSLNLIEGENAIEIIFKTFDSFFKATIPYKNGTDPFNFKSWKVLNVPFYHLLKDDESVCGVCGKTAEEDDVCPYFDFGVRKLEVIGGISIHREDVFNLKIDKFIKMNNIKDLRTKQKNDEFFLEFHSMEEEEPLIHLQLMIGNMPYILSDIKWKKGEPKWNDITKIKNWDYENAYFKHADSETAISFMKKFSLESECYFCGKKLDYRSDDITSRKCHEANNEIGLKREILKKSFEVLDERTLDVIIHNLYQIAEESEELKRKGKKAKGEVGFIYFLEDTSSKAIKIGRADDFERRTTEITRTLPYPTKLLRVYQVHDMVEAEKTIHKHFAKKVITYEKNGSERKKEWFELDDKDIVKIIELNFPKRIKDMVIDVVL